MTHSRDWRDHADLLAEIVRLEADRDARLRRLQNDRPDGFVADSSEACASTDRATPAEAYARLRAVQYVHERIANAYRRLSERIAGDGRSKGTRQEHAR